MTIQELATRANVTTRTIRYYVDWGILPPPERGRPARYSEEHLRRLDLIRRLKEQYLPLEEIRDIMGRLSVNEVEELIASYKPPTQEARALPASAAEYASNLLRQGAVREEKKRSAPLPPPSYSPLPASDYELREKQPVFYRQTEGTWKRLTIAPGVELHYEVTGDEADDMESERLAAELVRAARDILNRAR